MMPRSPAYPGIGLGQAIALVEKIHNKNRTNPIDREAAAKDMGFAGITGSSTKALADLAHFGLIDKAGKGSIRTSQRAVDILYPLSQASKAEAVKEAAFAPALFAELRKHFHDGIPSDNALKGYLVRQQFISAAIPLVISGYLETCRLVQQLDVNESHGQADSGEQNGQRETVEPPMSEGRPGTAPGQPNANWSPASPSTTREGVKVVDGERVVFIEEGRPAHYLKLVASGDLDETLLEALEDYIKRQKKRLAGPKNPAVN